MHSFYYTVPNTGNVVYTVHMPDTFVGKDLMSYRESADEPHAGGLYAAKVPFLRLKRVGY